MERRFGWSWTALCLLAIVGCNGSSSGPAAAPSDPAARVAGEFLEAVVKGNTDRATELLTPLAVERIKASGKPFRLPGLANYSYQVGEVRRPSEDKAFVQCKGTDRSTDGKTIDEEFCWLLSRVGDQWRVSGISYTAGPKQTLMIYSFENPEQGAVPVQQMMARASDVNANGTRPSPPHTAQEAVPAAAYH